MVPDSVGFYVSGQCSYRRVLLGKQTDQGFIGTNKLIPILDPAWVSASSGYKNMLGEDSVPISLRI